MLVVQTRRRDGVVPMIDGNSFMRAAIFGVCLAAILAAGAAYISGLPAKHGPKQCVGWVQ